MGYLYFSSSALLLDSLATLVDVVSSCFLIICIKLAERPPDREHPFGHGRYEPLAGLQLGLFLAIGGAMMGFREVCDFFIVDERREVASQAWLLPLIACLLLEWMYRKIMKIAVREHAPALTAEANHFRIDSLNSFIALFALFFGALFPTMSWASDKIGAFFIALFMVGVGLYAARANIHQLLDRIPEPRFFDLVKQAAMKVEGILGTEKVLIQLSGPDAHVDIDVEVDPLLSVEKAHYLSQLVRLEIQKAWPQVRQVVVHIEPFYVSDHHE